MNNKTEINTFIKIEKIIKLIQLNQNTLLSELSGGLLRKVALGRVLIEEPDLLLLDEPTNHLDLKTTEWLKKFLKKFSGSILFVSHDRNFIQKISTRIVDLDRGKLISWPGNYENFIKLKNESIRLEKIEKKLSDQKLEKEEKWIRQGIKARTTRNEGRIKNLKILRQENNNYKKIEKLSNIQINQSKDYLGKIIFKLNNVCFFIEKKIIIKNFSSIIKSGDKLGLIGSNGSGKSTIIKIITGKLKPQKGTIYIGKGLKISYFDQNRSLLNPNKSIIDNMVCGKEKITINGKEHHLIGYLKKFLFLPNKLNSLVKTLSGGECNRLLLARLFLQPSNVLILDEPTNDLDLDTLQLLEKVIINYTGTVLIVSHDQEFIKNIVNKYWLIQENGLIETYSGKYDISKVENQNIKNKKTNDKTENKNILNTYSEKNIKNLKREINKTLHEIEKIECIIKELQKKINNPFFFKNELKEKLPTLKNLTKQEKKLEEKLKYWEKLEKNKRL